MGSGNADGYGVRDYNWDFTAEVQHELRPGSRVNAGYYHNTGGYFRDAFGSAFTRQGARRPTTSRSGPDDYDPYCVTAPLDPRLPGGGGYQVCGLADLKPENSARFRTT